VLLKIRGKADRRDIVVICPAHSIAATNRQTGLRSQANLRCSALCLSCGLAKPKYGVLLCRQHVLQAVTGRRADKWLL
jgi:hypothetical protein